METGWNGQRMETGWNSLFYKYMLKQILGTEDGTEHSIAQSTEHQLNLVAKLIAVMY